jgi:hypothetical protein
MNPLAIPRGVCIGDKSLEKVHKHLYFKRKISARRIDYSLLA